MHSYRESVAHVFYEKPANFSEIGWWLLKKLFSNVVKNGWYAPFSLRNEHNSNDSARKTSWRHRILKTSKKIKKSSFFTVHLSLLQGAVGHVTEMRLRHWFWYHDLPSICMTPVFKILVDFYLLVKASILLIMSKSPPQARIFVNLPLNL